MKPIRLILSNPEGELPSGSSRFWGNPDLPKGFPYPMYIDEEGDEVPYVFICQINLADLADFDCDTPLPSKGLLSFFAKIDRYLGDYGVEDSIVGHISDEDDVKVLYFPDCEDMVEMVLVDDDDCQISPSEMGVGFSHDIPPLSDENILFAPPAHREWETWDSPFEDWSILLQIDSFEGEDFALNFMDCGVLDLLISPDDLKNHRFDRVRGIVLST